jgi:hypothetical protein
MCDSHFMIINNVGKVIGREPIPLNDDEIIFLLRSAVTSVDKILHLGFASALESNAMWFAICGTAIGFGYRDMAASAIVVAMAAALREILQIVPLKSV